MVIVAALEQGIEEAPNSSLSTGRQSSAIASMKAPRA
jgi:hypothetical protein